MLKADRMHIKMQLFCVCCSGTVFIMQCTEEINKLLFKNKILRHFAFSLRLIDGNVSKLPFDWFRLSNEMVCWFCILASKTGYENH